MSALHVDPSRRRYDALIGTGGIGSGLFFALNGNHTLGREESRSGRFLDRKDYCKLHIVAHYLRTLMGPDFITLPIGRVGDDEPGRRLLEEMAEAGLDLRYVHVLSGEHTLYSVCFVYPDGSGGNLTIDDSACARVDAASIREAEADFCRFAGYGIALAMPEVPLAARAELLRLGTQYRFLRAASFTSGEMAQVRDSDVLTRVDLLAINIDEAAILAHVGPRQEPLTVVEGALKLLRQVQPTMMVSITAGMHGSWTWDGEILAHVPARKVEVVGTAGAGDAHLAGVLAGLAAGLSLGEAHELGALTAALSVTSPHTIHKGIDRQSLKALADTLHRHREPPLCAGVRRLLAS
jgi:sugar/nucleoside kinase (ribokinase family)